MVCLSAGPFLYSSTTATQGCRNTAQRTHARVQNWYSVTHYTLSPSVQDIVAESPDQPVKDSSHTWWGTPQGRWGGVVVQCSVQTLRLWDCTLYTAGAGVPCRQREG